MRILTGRHLRISSVRFSPDGRFLVSDGHRPILGDWYVTVWQVHGGGNPKHTTPGKIERRDGFTSNRRQLLLHQGNKQIALSLSTGKVVLDPAPLSRITCETSPDRRWTVCHEWDILPDVYRLRVVSRVGRRRVERWTREFPRIPAPTGDSFDGEEASFKRLGFAVNATRILVAYTRHDRNALNNALVNSAWPADDRRGWDGRYIFEQEIVWVLDTETGQDVAEWRGEPSTLTGPNAELLYLRGPSFRVLDVLNLVQPAITRTNSSREHFTAAAFSPDGKLLATTSNDTTVTMWDTATWEPIRQYGWEIGRLRAVAFAPDGLTCAAGSDTGKVVLWDIDG
jgi:WD40 repeat protein